MLLAAAGFSFGQPATSPKAYTLVQAFSLKPSGPPDTTTVYRDGNLIASMQSDGKRTSYARIDLAAKTGFTWEADDPDGSCTGDHFPKEWASKGNLPFEPFGGTSEYLMKAVNEGDGARKSGVETIHGFAVTVFESAPNPNGRMKVWQDPLSGMVWKAEFAPGEDPRMHVIFEVKEFTIGKPAAAKFTLPAGCLKPAPPKENGSK